MPPVREDALHAGANWVGELTEWHQSVTKPKRLLVYDYENPARAFLGRRHSGLHRFPILVQAWDVGHAAAHPLDWLPSEPAIEEAFREHADAWRRETVLESSAQRIAMHRAYQQIIGLGPPAVPLILRELRREPNYWFWALTS